jgi:class 3 adenylate cyclase
MSLVGDRQAIAAALSGVAGVRGYAYRPKTTKPGDAWPLLGRMDRAAGDAFTINWRVLVLLPQDEAAASEWIDSHVEQLVDALAPVGFVDPIEPVALGASGSDQYALQITMRSD